jgi:chemotaxis protein methyltransferase CheR
LALAAAEMPVVADWVQEVSGIFLDPSKDYLIDSRLGPFLKRMGVGSYSELVDRARQDQSGRLRASMVDAVTTNETMFFRDQWPFDLLAHKLVPDVLQHQEANPARGGRPRLDVWCAAASTGQEVYSLAIVLKEMLYDLGRYWIRILGTDISEWALSVASRGFYTDFEASRGLTDNRLKRFFTRVEGGWRIQDELRAQATFAPLNLIERFRHVGTFDIILCRNVAIYFSVPHRAVLFDRLADQLRPGGVLLVGATESLHGLTKRFAHEEFHGASFYRKVE